VVGGPVALLSLLFGGLIDQVQRRETLLARKVSRGYQRFDIRMQGEGETVFMDI
jgi:protocatechuate 3,4-dioxygenase alpha subunit